MVLNHLLSRFTTAVQLLLQPLFKTFCVRVTAERVATYQSHDLQVLRCRADEELAAASTLFKPTADCIQLVAIQSGDGFFWVTSTSNEE